MEHEQLEMPPVYLSVGTEVSAKFKGAFCEARITKLVKLVKIKVQLSDSAVITVDETAIQSGRLEINQHVEVTYMKQIHKGQIICIKDCSSYTVIFNDGDERILKRTQLCQKGAKHFKEAETLDKLPLYHPDKRSKKKKEEAEKKSFIVSPNSQSPRHFRSSSVTPLKGIASTRSATRAIARLQFEEVERSASAAADCPSSVLMSNFPTKSSSLSPHPTTNLDLESEEMFPCEQQSTSAANDGIVTEKQKTDVPGVHYPLGTPVIVNAFAPPKFGGRIQLGLIVSLDEFKLHYKSPISLLQFETNQVAFRSFQNGRYFMTSFERLKKFDPVETQGLTDFGSMGMKLAFERANNYVLRGELPQSWTRKAGTVELKKKKPKKAEKLSDSSSTEDDDDSEYNERRDLCVAHFYKFQDESGNQLNKVPLLGGKEIDIYRFYDVVSRMGGHKRVTQETGWRRVLRKLHLEDTGVSPTTVKNSYIRYFEKFEAFMKNLGYSSLTVSSSTPSTNSRTTRIIRGYNPTDSKLTDMKKKARSKERISLDRGQSISKEMSCIAIKSRSGSISSIKTASPAMTAAARSHEQPQRIIHLGKPSSESINALNDDTNIEPNQERAELNLKASTYEKLESLEKKRTHSQELTFESRSASLEGSPTTSTNNKETNEPEKIPFPKKVQGIRGRRPKIPRDQRTKSPSGHQAVLEDIGYTNANIFTRFYQGQNVHARHHLRFYDARVIMVKQPTLSEIATFLCDAFDLSIISRQISQNLTDLSYENMGAELKKALHDIMMSTKIFVHYLGWNSRYDEWLMLHKIRVDEKDEKSSSKALEQLIPGQLPAEMAVVAMNWCRSAEGIASLATLPSAQSSEQRPRRLSSATLAKTNSNLVRKYSEVMPPEESNKHSNSQSSHQVVATNSVPVGMDFCSPVANCVYSVPPLSTKTVGHQQPNHGPLSDLVFCSTSSPLSPHTFVPTPSKCVELDRTSSAFDSMIIPFKNDSVGNSLVPMTPYSIVVKTSPSSASLFNTTNILTSTGPTGEDNKDPEDVCASSNNKPASLSVPSLPKEVNVGMQTHFTKGETSDSDCQAKKIIFVNAAPENCQLNIKIFSSHERKVVVFQHRQQEPTIQYGATTCFNLSEGIKTTHSKEEHKDTAQQQQAQSTNSKKRTAGFGSLSPPTKMLKQTNKIAGRGGGRKTSIDATTETSEDDEGSEGFHNINMQSLKQRVLQKMEDEHLFDDYSFVGLSELDDELANCVLDPDEQVRLIEGRMRELREIYHKYKAKLTDLEKAQKKRKSARKMMADK